VNQFEFIGNSKTSFGILTGYMSTVRKCDTYL